MAFRAVKKGTLLIPSGTGYAPDKRHLFVICTDACSNGQHLLVPIATWQNDLSDPTCKLAAGDHDFIKHPSYVLYRKARIELATTLIAGVHEKAFSPHDPMNASAGFGPGCSETAKALIRPSLRGAGTTLVSPKFPDVT
jgi:hypothetical protein